MNSVSQEDLIVASRRRAIFNSRSLFWQVVTAVGKESAQKCCRVLRKLSDNDNESPEHFDREYARWKIAHPHGNVIEFIDRRLGVKS